MSPVSRPDHRVDADHQVRALLEQLARRECPQALGSERAFRSFAKSKLGDAYVELSWDRKALTGTLHDAQVAIDDLRAQLAGTGSTPTQHPSTPTQSGSRVLTPSAFEALSIAQKNAHIRSGGKVSA